MQSMLISMHKLVGFLFLIPTLSFAQFEDISTIATDLVLLSQKYVEPIAEASVYQSSGGWYTSAKKKELWDLQISVQGNLLFIPKKSSDFLIEESRLLNLSIQGDATTAYAPTGLGGVTNVVLEGSIDGEVFEFDSPEGLSQSYLPHAQVQMALTMWHGTTLIGRYSPKININSTQYELFGFGLKHNLSQWLMNQNNTSLNLAGLITYSNYSVNDTFSEIELPIGSLNSINVDGQTFSFNILASKGVDNFTFSTAIGLATSKFE